MYRSDSTTRSEKRVVALVGSGHAGGATATTARMFLEKLESLGGVETELVRISDYELGVCRGCKACFARGEELCPLKDGRDALIAKISDADATVWVSPNYSFQASGQLKLFLDRLGFMCHRPRFHGKAATSIVVQGFYGGGKIVKYLDFLSGALGFNVVKGSVVATLEPMTAKSEAARAKVLDAHARRFHARLTGPAYPVPSLLALMLFRMGRQGVRMMLTPDKADHIYYREHGWFDADFYYPTHLGLVKRAFGALVDRLAIWMNRGSAAAPEA